MLNNEYIAMQPTGQRSIYILLLLILLFGFVTFVFSTLQFLGGSSFSSKAGSDINFFDSQNAMVTGTITEVKSNMISVQNKSGLKKDFKLAKNIMINGGTSNGVTAAPVAPSSDIKNIPTGKMVMISLMIEGDALVVSSISPVVEPIAPGSNGGNPASKTNPATSSANLPAPTAPAVPPTPPPTKP